MYNIYQISKLIQRSVDASTLLNGNISSIANIPGLLAF
jgi:hypothetical protein